MKFFKIVKAFKKTYVSLDFNWQNEPDVFDPRMVQRPAP